MLFRGKGDQSETSLLQQGAERSQLSCDSFIQGSPSCPLKKAEEEQGRSMFWEASRMQITARRHTVCGHYGENQNKPTLFSCRGMKSHPQNERVH